MEASTWAGRQTGFASDHGALLLVTDSIECVKTQWAVHMEESFGGSSRLPGERKRSMPACSKKAWMTLARLTVKYQAESLAHSDCCQWQYSVRTERDWLRRLGEDGGGYIRKHQENVPQDQATRTTPSLPQLKKNGLSLAADGDLLLHASGKIENLEGNPQSRVNGEGIRPQWRHLCSIHGWPPAACQCRRHTSRSDTSTHETGSSRREVCLLGDRSLPRRKER
jgi:hypothetical protein